MRRRRKCVRFGKRWGTAGAALLIVSQLVACAPPADPPPLPTVSVQIDDGRQATNSLSATLSIIASPNVATLRIAHGTGLWALLGLLSGTDLSPTDQVNWELLDGFDGERSVTVMATSVDGTVAFASDSIDLDRVAPSLAVSDPLPGATLDLSKGQLGQMRGAATDDRSGLADVRVEGPDGKSVSAVRDGDTWAIPVGAPETRLATYAVSATDVAGNTARQSIELHLIGPDASDEPIVRPTTINLADGLVSKLAAVNEDSLDFTGDVTPALAGRTTIISGVIDPLAPEGLLRSIEQVDVVGALTRVKTSQAQPANAFAQFELGTPPVSSPVASSLRSAAIATNAASCAAIGAGARFRDERPIDTAFNIAGVTVSGKIVTYADLYAKVRIGWITPEVEQARLAIGTGLCLDVAVGSAIPAVGVDVPIAEIQGLCGLLAGVVPYCLQGSLSAGLKIEGSTSTSSGSVVAGLGYHYRRQAGSPDDSGFDRFGDVTVAEPQDVSTFATTADAKLGLGLRVGGGLAVGLIESSVEGSLRGRSSATAPSATVCWNASLKAGPDLSIKVLGASISLFKFQMTLAQVNDNDAGEGCVSREGGSSGTTTSTTSSTTTTTLPTGLHPMSGVSAVALGGLHTCVIVDGKVKCWGERRSAIGDPSSASVIGVPASGAIASIPIPGVPVQIAAGEYHTCALTSSGEVYCWGYNAFGQVGGPPFGSASYYDYGPPRRVSGIGKAIKVVVGRLHSCALLMDRTLWCWGDNGFGQLGLPVESGGDPFVNARRDPIQVPGLSPVADVVGSSDNTCVITTDRRARCWGSAFGRTVANSVADRVAAFTGVNSISVGIQHMCAITTLLAECVGSARLGSTSPGYSEWSIERQNLLKITSSGDTDCLSYSDNAIKCYGKNFSGEAGADPTVSGDFIAIPRSVAGIAGPASVIGNYASFCALLENSTATCWGNNGGGRIGIEEMGPFPLAHPQPTVLQELR